MGYPATRRSGALIEWDDARGFGWVEEAEGSRRVFLHVTAYPDDAPRPMVGDELTFILGRGEDGRRQAQDVELLHSERATRQALEAAETGSLRRRGRVSLLPLLVVPLFVILFILILARWNVPIWVLVLYPAMSVATFFLYLLDKRAALEGTWRVRETTLLLAGMLGGWPGAVVAQQVLRHKNRKWEFQAAFWCLAVLNIAIFLLLIWYKDPISTFLSGL